MLLQAAVYKTKTIYSRNISKHANILFSFWNVFLDIAWRKIFQSKISINKNKFYSASHWIDKFNSWD